MPKASAASMPELYGDDFDAPVLDVAKLCRADDSSASEDERRRSLCLPICQLISTADLVNAMMYNACYESMKGPGSRCFDKRE